MHPSEDKEDANLSLSDLRGLAWGHPLPAAALTVFMFSLTGIPPTAGFFGKFYIFQQAIGQKLITLAIIGVLNTVFSVYYYLRPVVEMYMHGEEPGQEAAPIAVSSEGTAIATRSVAGLSVGVAISACVVGVLGMIVLQGIAFEWARQAAAILPGP